MVIETIAKISSKWVWEEFGKDWSREIVGEIKRKWGEFHWAEAEIAYRKRLIEIYGTVRLLGNPKPINLQNIFTDVYVLDKISAFRRYDIDALLKNPEQDLITLKEKRKSILRIAVSSERLFILGKPGAGKTTFLKFLAIQACLGKIEQTPIFVSLKEWRDTTLPLNDFIVKQFEICQFPDPDYFLRKLLEKGKALILFDGLDEVNEMGKLRQQTIADIITFSRNNPKNKIFLTCRIAAVDYSFDNFTYLEIADFDKRQIKSFVSKWYQGNQSKNSKFIEQIEKPENKGFLELARTPLLLALFCLAFDETMTFPEKRVDLYKEALDALLKKWDSSRGIQRDTIYKSLSPVRKEHLLSKIAIDNYSLSKYFMSKDDVKRQIEEYIEQLPSNDYSKGNIDGEQILNAIEAQHGILVMRAKDVYSFSHLTFQEYLAARFIVENAAQGTITKLIQDYDSDARWHEIVLLVSNILSNAEPLLNGLSNASTKHLSTKSLKLLKLIERDIYQTKLEKGFVRLVVLLIALITGQYINKEKTRKLLLHSAQNKKEIDRISELMSQIKTAFYLGLEILPLIGEKDNDWKKVSSLLEPALEGNIRIENIPSKFAPILGFDIRKIDLNFTEMMDMGNIIEIQKFIKFQKLLVECLESSVVPNRSLYYKNLFS